MKRILLTFAFLQVFCLPAMATQGFRLDGAIQESGLPLSGGTLTGAICWYASTQSVCVDSTSDGVLKFYGSGGTNNEDLSWDYETTANTVAIASSTGVTQLTFSGMDLKPDTVTLGTGGQWAGGSNDDEILLQETGGPTDNVCFKTGTDQLYIYQGDCSTVTTFNSGGIVATGAVTTQRSTGGFVQFSNTTDPGSNDQTLGEINFGGFNTAGTETSTLAEIEATHTDAGVGTADTEITFKVAKGGAVGVKRLSVEADDIVRITSPVSPILILDDSTVTGNASGVGYIRFEAADDADNEHTMAQIEMDVTDASTGAEYADLVFYAATNGTDATEYLRIDSSIGGITFSNGTTGATVSAGTSDDMLCIIETGATTDNACIKTISDQLWLYDGTGLSLTTARAANFTAAKSDGTGVLAVYDSGAAGTGSSGKVKLQAKDAGGTDHDFAQIELDVTDTTAGAEYGDMVFYSTTNGTDATEYMRIDSSAGGVSIPATKKLIFDGDGDQDTHIHEQSEDRIDIYTGGVLNAIINAGRVDTHAAGEAYFRLQNNTSPVGDGNDVGTVEFRAIDSGAGYDNYAEIKTIAVVDTATSEEGDLVMSVMSGGSLTEVLRVDGSEGDLHFAQGYTRHVNFPINAANQGASAPTAVTIGNARCLSFADGEIAHIEWSVPADWDGASDMTFELHTFLDSSDSPTNGEDMCFDISYNAVALGELYDKTSTTGEMVLDLATATQKAHYEPSYTIDYDDADNPLAAGDEFLLSFTFEADAGGSCGTGGVYGGEVIVCGAHVEYTSNALPEN